MRPTHHNHPTLTTHNPKHRINNKYKRVSKKLLQKLQMNQRNGIKIAKIIQYKNLTWTSLIVIKNLTYSIRLLRRLRTNYNKSKTKTSPSSTANAIGQNRVKLLPRLTSLAMKTISLTMSYKWSMRNKFRWETEILLK